MTSSNWYDQEPYLAKYNLAELMHETYENAAKITGWATNDQCHVAFDDLPEANKKTMLAVAEAIVSSVPLIIEKTKEMEREREYHINCRNCGASTFFSPNDFNSPPTGG